MTTILNHFRFPSFLLPCEWIVIRKTCLTKGLLAHIYLDIVLLPFVSSGEIGSISMFVLVPNPDPKDGSTMGTTDSGDTFLSHLKR